MDEILAALLSQYMQPRQVEVDEMERAQNASNPGSVGPMRDNSLSEMLMFSQMQGQQKDSGGGGGIFGAIGDILGGIF